MLLLTQAPPLRKAENVGCVFSEREAKQVHTDPHPTKNRKSCSVFTGRQTDNCSKAKSLAEIAGFCDINSSL